MNFRAWSDGDNIRRQKIIWRTGRSVGLFALCGVLASCQTAPLYTTVFRRDFRPDNVFVYPTKLSLDFRRVAVLPIAPAANDHDLPEGCEALNPVLWEQIVKTKKFEAVTVDASHLSRRTGRAAWTGNEVLPPDFLAYLRREYDCDGVLFAELTTYRAYSPLAVGWRFKLVDARTGQIIWSADELFDASRPEIQRAADHFEAEKPAIPLITVKNWAMTSSPRLFGRYTAAALLDTLPER
ncbi:MAG TPA: hypothetical protein VK815_00080 [Candidatus Acidoferrales bacterium]|jgi:hypothetical protein|nr:hypothetical protein [Candidatus Acidoferrales bacterium]